MSDDNIPNNNNIDLDKVKEVLKNIDINIFKDERVITAMATAVINSIIKDPDKTKPEKTLLLTIASLVFAGMFLLSEDK